jgi:hypothetical protein
MDRVMFPILLALAIPSAPGTIPVYAELGAATNAAVDRWQAFITEAERRFNVPEAWIRAVMQAESGGLTMVNGHPITSRAGAMGLMQVMPGTYESLRLAHGLGADPYDPRDNILAGTAYLRAMYDRYGYRVYSLPTTLDRSVTTSIYSTVGLCRPRHAPTSRHRSAWSRPRSDIVRGFGNAPVLRAANRR